MFDMNRWLQWYHTHNNDLMGIGIKLFFIVLTIAILQFVVSIVLKQFCKPLHGRYRTYPRLAIEAARRPVAVWIWLLGLTYTIDIVSVGAKNPAIFDLFEPVRALGTVAVILWFVLRFISRVEAHYLSQQRIIDKHQQDTVRAVSRLLRVASVITLLLIGLQTAGISVTGLLAFGGVGAAGVAFAAKDILGNFFGGLMIHLNRPFGVGDWINSPDKQLEGTVESIGWLLTRIRSFDKRPIYVPNGLFSNIVIVNPSRMLNRRIYHTVGVRYQDASKIPLITQDIEKMLKSHEEIDSKQTLMVNLYEFSPSSLNFFIYTFTKTTNWVKFQAIQQDVFLKIIHIVESHGASCAFPTRTLDMPKEVLEALQAEK